MVFKEPIRNEHRYAFREGKFDEIPADVLALLQAQERSSEQPKEEKKKEKKEDK